MISLPRLCSQRLVLEGGLVDRGQALLVSLLLPGRLLRGIGGSTPLGGGTSGGGSGGGSPVLAGTGTGSSTVPASASGGAEAGSGSLPVTTSLLEAGLNGGGALLVNAGELLLLDLVLSLSLGVAV
jgi:hypothetical protein